MSSNIRRYVGANEWQAELDQIVGLGERLVEEITEMSQAAATVEATRRHTKLIGYSSQMTIAALKLKGYKQREEATA